MSFLKGFRKGMHAFGDSIAVIVNSVLLAIVYAVGIGITSIFCKLIRKQFIDLKPDKKTKTYWVELDLHKRPKEEFYRQF